MDAPAIFKTFVDEKYGGIGNDHTNFAHLIERLRSNTHISYLMIVNQLLCGQSVNANLPNLPIRCRIGAIRLRAIEKYGNEKQKRYYLSKLSSGQSLGGFCLHELSSGNNIHMMEGSAQYFSANNTFKVSAKKSWIFNAQFMGMCIVFVKMKNQNGADCLSAFVKDNPLNEQGVHVTPCHNVLNIQNVAHVTFDNVSFSGEDLLGNIGDGFKIAVQLQNCARFAIAAALLGITKEAFSKQLDHKLSSSMVTAKIAKWSAKIFAVECALYFSTGLADHYSTCTFDSEFAAVKVQAAKTAFEVVNGCIDLMRWCGEEDTFYLELLNKVRGLELFLGSSDVLTHFVGGVAIKHNLYLINDDVLKLKNSHDHIKWRLNFMFVKSLPSEFRKCSIGKNAAAADSCLSFLKKEIAFSLCQFGFNAPNQDSFQATVGKCLISAYHLLAVYRHYNSLPKDKLSSETELLIKESLDSLRVELIDTLGEGYDRLSFNISTTKNKAISKIVTKNEVHGIQSAITRNW